MKAPLKTVTLLRFTVLPAVALFATGVSHAQTIWTGATSDSFAIAGKWSAGIPTKIANPGLSAVVNALDSGGDPSVINGAAWGIDGNLNINGGTVTLTSFYTMDNDSGNTYTSTSPEGYSTRSLSGTMVQLRAPQMWL